MVQRGGGSDAEALGLWNQYVSDHLLPRLHGYELLMAPYAIAHAKIGLKLYETGYRFDSAERVRVFLTNALEPAEDFTDRLEFAIPALAHEGHAVNEVKSTAHFTVVIGNPPYAYMSANLTDKARRLVDRFRDVDGVRIVEKNAIGLERTLQDDYVKFFAASLNIVEPSEAWVLSLISNNTFFENLNLRGMRRSLMLAASAVRIVDLHGDANQREKTPDGRNDENVFEIRKGVGITTAIRLPEQAQSATHIERADVLGAAAEKYDVLSRGSLGVVWTTITPRPVHYRWRAGDEALEAEWAHGVSLTSLLHSGATGVETGKDSILVGFTGPELTERLARVSDPSVTGKELETEFSAASGHGSRILARRRTIEWIEQERDALLRSVSLAKSIVLLRANILDPCPLAAENSVSALVLGETLGSETRASRSVNSGPVKPTRIESLPVSTPVAPL